MANEKTCTHCLETKLELCFSADKKRKDGLSSVCRECKQQDSARRRTQKKSDGSIKKAALANVAYRKPPRQQAKPKGKRIY